MHSPTVVPNSFQLEGTRLKKKIFSTDNPALRITKFGVLPIHLPVSQSEEKALIIRNKNTLNFINASEACVNTSKLYGLQSQEKYIDTMMGCVL